MFYTYFSHNYVTKCITWFLVSVRPEVKHIDISVIVHELELALERDIVFYEVEVTSITK